MDMRHWGSKPWHPGVERIGSESRAGTIRLFLSLKVVQAGSSDYHLFLHDALHLLFFIWLRQLCEASESGTLPPFCSMEKLKDSAKITRTLGPRSCFPVHCGWALACLQYEPRSPGTIFPSPWWGRTPCLWASFIMDMEKHRNCYWGKAWEPVTPFIKNKFCLNLLVLNRRECRFGAEPKGKGFPLANYLQFVDWSWPSSNSHVTMSAI